MSNEFYTYGDTLIGGTTANAEDVGAEFNALVTAFDKLPTEAQLKSGQLNYVVDTGAANAYAVALPHTILSYAAGLTLTFKAANANTGASTLNVDSVGVIPIVKTDGTALDAGDIQAGALVTVTYDGSNFQAVGSLQGVIAAAEAARDAALAAKTAAETAQTNAETAETNAETAESNAATEVTYAAEWASKAEDSAVSVAAGGDGSTTFSAKHWSAKAEDWAQTVNIPSVAGQSGKFLSNDGTNKSWETVSNMLVEVSLTGVESAVDLSLPDGYSKFVIDAVDLGYKTIAARFSSDGGSTFDSGATDYRWKTIYNQTLSSVDRYNSQGDHIKTSFGADWFSITVFSYGVSKPTCIFGLSALASVGSEPHIYYSVGHREATSLTNAIRLFPTTGTFVAGGVIRLYGVK